MISGQLGTIHIGSSELLSCYAWSFSRKASTHERAHNDSAQHKEAVAGTSSGSGTMKGSYDPDDPVEDHVEEGDSVTAKLYVNATKFYEVPMVTGSLDMEVDFDEGTIVGWDISFVCNGTWTKPV